MSSGLAPPVAASTLASDVIARLEQHGVRHVFGIPGIHNLPLYQALESSRIEHVSPRHEQGAGYAADGYARASGTPGVCIVTSGPGLTNLVTAIATSHADSVPVLVISPGMEDAVSGHDTGFLHELKDQHGLMDRVVRSVRVHTASQAVAAIDLAFASFRANRPRPVHIEIPIDRLGVGGGASFAPLEIGSPAPDVTRIRQAAELLASATAPAMVLGGGARNAGPQALTLARLLRCPIVTTVNGKGTVSEYEPLSLGASIRLDCVQRFLGQRDVLLVVGSELAESDLWHPPPLESAATVIRIDVDPEQLQKNIAVALPIHGEAATTLAAITVQASRSGSDRADEDLEELRHLILEEARRDGRQFERLMQVLEHALPHDAIVASDSTMACYYGAVHFLRQQQPSQLLYPTGYATLGYGLPAAIGAKLAFPDRPVITLIGDGGILFTIQELATAVERRLALPIIVVNNGGYGEIRRAMVNRGMRPAAVDLTAPDFVRIASAFGAHGHRATSYSEVGELLVHALKADLPTVIEIEEERIP